jgi:hypothetical protein
MADAGGRSGPPLDRQLYNGRVVGYRMPGSGTASHQTSEWLGAGGGPRRSGPVGAPADLGPAAPLAASAANPVYYPNPVHDDWFTVRFYSHTDRPAQLAVYNLEGEEVVRTEIPAVAQQLNEHTLTVTGLASGLYLCRLQRETTSGLETTVTTLAVER